MKRIALACLLLALASVSVDGQSTWSNSLYRSWTPVPYASGNFTGNASMTWTVAEADVITNRYMMLDRHTMVWQLSIENADIGGTPNNLLLATLPAGKVSSRRTGGAILIANNSAEGSGRYLVTDGGTAILLFQQTPTTSWTSGTAVNEIEFMLIIEVD